MPLLNLQTVLQARQAALQKASQPLTGPIGISHGTPTTQLNAIATPPPKKNFCIFSWNIQDYKGSKIVAEKKGKEQNPFIHQFVKVVAEALKTDLMMIIETDVDLTEAVAEIEVSPESQFGFLMTSPPPKTPTVYDPTEDETLKRDDAFYDEVKKRAELFSDGDTLYWPFASEMSFRRVNLPPSFTFAQLQKGILKKESWWEELEGVSYCYDAFFKKQPAKIDWVIQQAQKTSTKLTADYEFRLRTVCPNCSGFKRRPSTKPCIVCCGHGRPKAFDGKAMDFGCPDCHGHKQVMGTVVCGACQGNKVIQEPCFPCGGTGNCSNCKGAGSVLCPACGGPVGVKCPKCVGSGVFFGSPCTDCGGRGGGFFVKPCQACQSRGFLGCNACGGAKICKACNGAKTVPQTCMNCGGAGQAQSPVACGNCGGSGVNPEYICSHCKGAGKTPCVNCVGLACTSCGGAGQIDCVQCNATGVTPDSACIRCDGTATEGGCTMCAGTGSFDPEAEDRALQTLRDLLTPEAFPNIDVETYTLLWRTGSVTLPSKVMGGMALACEDKAVWLDPNRAGLCSKDENGNELGYQDPASKFNSRSPYVIPLYMDLNGNKRLLVPVVLFHAIWGEVTKMKAPAKTALIQGRAESVYKLQALGVQDRISGGAIPVHKAPGSILVGDFNLDYNSGKKPRDKYNSTAQGASLKAFADLIKNGYIAPVGGTQTGLTPLKDGISRLQKTGGRDIHTYAYDNFLVKGADLQSSIVNCGVFDVLSLIEDLLSKDAKLVLEIDKDYGQKPNLASNRARAFYIYRKYVSDHLPIILDILVDEIDPQHKKWIEEQKKFGLQLQPMTGIERRFGRWTAIDLEAATAASINVEGSVATVVGVVTMIWFPDIISVAVGDKVVLFGPSTVSRPKSSWLGKMVKGQFELGDRMSIRISDCQGTWTQIERCASQVKGFAVKGSSDGKEKLRGRLTWMDAVGNIGVSVGMGANSPTMVYQGKGVIKDEVAVGNWVEAIFQHS
jgi:hypothetical protein